MKKCIFCAEEIQDTAIVCRYCGKEQSKVNVPKCPTCGSKNVGKISTSSKAVKAALFGVFAAGAVAKTFKCNECKHQW